MEYQLKPQYEHKTGTYGIQNIVENSKAFRFLMAVRKKILCFYKTLTRISARQKYAVLQI